MVIFSPLFGLVIATFILSPCFNEGLDVRTPTSSHSPTVWVALAGPIPAGWELITLMTCSMSLESLSPHHWATGLATVMSPAT